MTDSTLRRLRPWLGTYVSIEACAADAARVALAVEDAFAEIATIHAAMSFHSAHSELAHLHREAHQRPVRIGWHTWAVLAQALHLAELSDGVFDPTIAPQLVRHGALPRPDGPAPDEAGNWRDIELLDEQQVRFRRPLWLDLGGIAKGYAVDCAVAALKRCGVRHGSVNAGGDLRAFGDAPEGLPLAVRNPADPTARIALGTLRNRAVATSGEFFLGREGNAGGLSPIVEPARGMRQAHARSVTVIAESCAVADGLTKIVSLLGPAAQTLLEHFGATAAIIEPPDQLHAAEGFWAALGHTSLPGDTCHA
jgi:thiamine biosynthesis lipoprotein